MKLRRLGLVSLLLLVLGALSLPADAQRQPGAQGCTLKVRLYYDNGNKIDQQLHVQLVDPYGSAIIDAFSDTRGEAEFQNVAPGNYRLSVSGLGVEDTTGAVFTINRGEGLHYENLDVKRKREASDSTPSGPGGTVSAADLNVPDKAKKDFEKGTAALQRNDLSEARKEFEKAIQIYPKYAGAYNNLGIIAMKAGDREAARAAFQQAVQINDHYPLACINLARLSLMDGKAGDAENLLNRALAIEPLNLEALTLLANVQLQTGRFDQAIATAGKVNSMPHDGFAVIHIVAAVALENRHMPREAAAEYTAYLKESPNGPAAQHARNALAALQKGP